LQRNNLSGTVVLDIILKSGQLNLAVVLCPQSHHCLPQ